MVDTSESMRAAKGIDLAWAVAQELVAAFIPPHRVGLLELREELELRSDLTNDAGALRQALIEASKQPPHGSTAVYNGVVAISRTLGGTGFADVVYLISDCEDSASMETDDRAVEAALQSGVRVFVSRVAVAPLAGGRRFPVAQSWATRITNATGGLVLEAGKFKAKELTRSLAQLVGEVYRLEVLLPRRVDRVHELKIEVLGPEGTKLDSVRLLYPRMLAPAPEPALSQPTTVNP